MKTLAIRLDDEIHARVTILARLRGVSVTDAIRAAIEAHVVTLSQDPDVSAKAKSLVDEIERDAKQQQDALKALFPADEVAPTAPPARVTRAKS